MELLLDIVFYFLMIVTILGWGSIFLCWALFGYATYKGWITEDMTPADILRKMSE